MISRFVNKIAVFSVMGGCSQELEDEFCGLGGWIGPSPPLSPQATNPNVPNAITDEKRRGVVNLELIVIPFLSNLLVKNKQKL